MASTRSNSFSSTLASFSFWLMPLIPGISPKIVSSEPIFLTCCICSRNCSSVNSSLRSFFSISKALARSVVDWIFSIRDRISPMPRIRDAIRSGWKGSKASSFSPIPTNLTGRPVTAFTDNTAPPLASPSSLVTISPSMPSSPLKLSATVTASWPVIASTTSNISCGLTAALILRSSSISSSLICKRPAVSMITVSQASENALSIALRAISTGDT